MQCNNQQNYCHSLLKVLLDLLAMIAILDEINVKHGNCGVNTHETAIAMIAVHFVQNRQLR